MKSSKQCPKCHSLKIGYLEQTFDYNTDDGADLHAPEPVGVIPKKGWVLTTNVPTGELEAYLCADCGYFETYVKSPGSVPFEELRGFRWVNVAPPADGPFR